jgi:hypothetical protein
MAAYLSTDPQPISSDRSESSSIIARIDLIDLQFDFNDRVDGELSTGKQLTE